MIIDLKYHIASLVAVFLALGLGILIGTSVLGSDTLIENQNKIIASLRQDYEKLNQENKNYRGEVSRLQEEVKKHREFEESVLPLLIKDRLAGRQIAVVESNVFPFRDKLVATLRMSGATVVSVTTFRSGWEKDAGKRAEIAKLFNLDEKVSEKELVQAVAARLPALIATGKEKELLDQLVAQEVIKINGEYGVPLSAVVVIGGSPDEERNLAEVFDLPVITGFQQLKIPVYGVESSDVRVSYIKTYQKARITTVDHADTAAGQLSLVWAIEKALTGDYGVKETAKQFAPAVGQEG